ncbi:Ig-like domain-containing protein [Microbacterium sp. XT11]|uniref:Ig-like domain-containing protein n=1 Tax=Microbacterium sp. XT11 TaxID=367477 RepID=UPI001E45D428|nr:Ig-like domain-containing protein [Microbacterium sp. XT11]
MKPKTLASSAAVTVGAIAITTMAFAYEGNPTTKVDLNDGGVWITKTSSLLVGHFNHESTVLDGGLRNGSDDYDILQDAAQVLVVDDSASTVTAVDPARVALTDSAAIPGSAKVALGNRTAAILDRDSGDLWVVPVSGIAAFEIKGTDPTVELGEHADVAVAKDGTVFGLSAQRGEVVTIPVDNQGEALDASTASIGEVDPAGDPSITAVGDAPVVLDPAAGAVVTPGGTRTEIGDADGALLQQPSAETDAVAVATASALVRVPLDGGEPQKIDAGGVGAPAAPVWLRGCTYGAWAGSASFVRECPGETNDVAEKIPDAEDSTSLVFRVNRDVIVLNDAVGGAAWLPNESLQRVDNWDDIVPPEGENENQEDTTEETVETTLPERSEQNTPPIAEDDEFGVRPGRTTMLPVLDNDTDADGDVLVASLAQSQPALGEVQPVNNGGSMQIAVDEDTTGGGSFEYQVDDGRGGKATATVQLTVHDWETNGAPEQRRTTGIAVEEGGSVSYNVLPDWLDPDGDDIYLRNVVAAPGDEVDFTTDGQVTYRAVASLQGRKDIQVTVADGLGETATGTLRLDVRPAGSTMPKTNADHVVTRVGEAISVSPLVNDTSSSREPLRLARVDEVPGATIVPDYQNKAFTFRSETAGVYYAQYLVSAGPNAVPGLVRIDVLPPSETQLPPIAVRDVALLPSGGEVLVGVLGNDTEPSGGILVVQSVTVPPHSGISVSVLNHETLRIGDQGALSEQVRISYRISNGTQSAEGDVIVIPIPRPEQLLPPVANDDQVVVRAGDVVTIPVLDNDTHPNGDVLHVDPQLVEPLVDPEDGEAFVSQDTVRFRASDRPGTVYLTYQAVDSMGQKDAGYVTVQVRPVDEESNSAPKPQDLTVRALSGSSVRIAIPLDGIDADGDSVELVGQESAPSKGQVAEVGTNYLVYEAFDDAAGVDSFTYRVRDRLGKEGVATIRVGIAPGDSANQAPYAVKDAVVVRPGRTIAVPVLANDSDPEGDAISLVKKGLEIPSDAGLQARVSGDRVVVKAPDRTMDTSIQYTIRDARGATATAVLQITVDDEVPLKVPTARDDRVVAADVTDSLRVDVDVLTNDEDPDGTVDALDLTVETGGVVQEDRSIRVTVGEQRQLIRYTVTDQDEQSASAFIFVPALSELRPTLSSTKPVEVKSGETIELPLSKYVTVAGGGDVVITEAAKVSAVNSDGSPLIKDQTTLVYTSKPGYFGKDALTFEVTDGTGPDDPQGRKATLTIPITVLPPENQPPVFVNGQVEVAPGEPATSLDLAALTTDPDPEDADKLRFRISGEPGNGISARVDGSKLLVEAGSSTPKGTSATVQLRIDDGTTEPVEGSVAVLVTASTRALPTANTDTIAEADQGKTITVPVLQNDVNPFPETPLKVVSVVPETGSGTAEISGSEVKVTPSADFVGTFVVRYRVQDATKDPDREVDGRIVLTVQGVPEAPGTPTVSSVQDRTVVLAWSPPANNGAEITSYTVRSVAGNYTKKCSSTTCTLDGLTNNVEYVFQVVATNRVGDSEPSPSSAVARPDARPDTPQPPKLVFGDKSLKVSWATPTTPGSPVESYTLEISPAPPSGVAQKTGVTGNSLVWEGLENGADYQVRVRAHNRAPEPSSWSGWSASEIPAGVPGTVAAPRAQSAPSVGSQAQMTVSWDAAPQNGDAIAEYELLVMRGGSIVNRVPRIAGTQHSQTVTVATSTADYTYAVRARNKAGWGAQSPASTPQRAFGSPGAPTITGAQEHDGYVTVQYSLSDTNGANSSEIHYEYTLDGSTWSRNWDGERINAANNGTYTVRVRAYSVVGGQESQPGPASAPSGALRPYGPVANPGVGAANQGLSVKVSWSAPAPNGRPIEEVQVRLDGGSWQNLGLSGSRNVGNGYDQTHTIEVRARDSAGQWSNVVSASARTDSKPQPDAWVTGGSYVSGCTNVGGGTCRKFVLNTSNFAGGSYNIECTVDGRVFGNNAGFPVDIPSNGSVQLDCYNGFGTSKGVNIIGGNPSKARPGNF